MSSHKIKLLVVDDSSLIRQAVVTVLEDATDVEIIGLAKNPFDAIEIMQVTKPDVILLDIQMPEMNGLTFLKKIMEQTPIPVIIFSSFAAEGSFNAIKALEYGAVEIIEKPKVGSYEQLTSYKDKLQERIRVVAKANVVAKRIEPVRFDKMGNFSKKIPVLSSGQPNFVIAIGASTGGTKAINSILVEIPKNCPPIIITQHMPVEFTKSFADRLDSLCHIKVKEAENFDKLEYGHAYVARGDRHLTLKKHLNSYQIVLTDSEPVNRHRPSVDVMFDSVAEVCGKNSMGIILTGMGGDGSKGLKKMRDKGSHTIAQDEGSCVVYGMPKVAKKIGAVDIDLPLFGISNYIIKILRLRSSL